MHTSEKQLQSPGNVAVGPRLSRWRHARAGLVWFGITIAAAAQNGQQNNGNQGNPSTQNSSQDAGLGRGWVAGPKIAIADPQDGSKNFEQANAERRKQLAEDSAQLLKMATDLKAEVDKTNKDTLSLSVVHKADEIEKLAHAVKEKMKLSVGANAHPGST